MKNRYKIILSNSKLYKEIELMPDMQRVKIGTGMDCDARLRKDSFFEHVELLLVKNEFGWEIHCSENLYLTSGDIRKLMTKQLEHGDILQVKYQAFDSVAFSFEFLLDFDSGEWRHDRIIDVTGVNKITMGSASTCTFILGSEFVRGDDIHLMRDGDDFILEIKQSRYGIYINGRKAKSGAAVQEGDFLTVSDYLFYFKSNRIWAPIRDDLHIEGLSYIDRINRSIYPRFNRNTRLKTVICEDAIEILDPPAKPQKPKYNLFTRLLPSMGMLLTAGVMAFLGGVMIIMSAISGTIAILTAILSIREGNKNYKDSVAERQKKYDAYIKDKTSEIEACRKQELKELEALYISQRVEMQRLDAFSADLFDRSPEDADFLCIRLGSGDIASKRAVDYKKKEKLEIEDDLQLIPEKLYTEYKYVHDAPIVCDLKEIDALGIVGAPEFRFDFLKNIVVDIASRHYFTDVEMVFVAEQANKDQIHWLRMLPHVYNDRLGVRNIVCDDESRNLIFEYLYKELSFRAENKTNDKAIVVFFYDEYGFKSHPISKFVDEAKALNASFIFFGESRADIPQGCDYIVEIGRDRNATLINAENRSEASSFLYTSLPTQRAENIVSLLAPVYTEEISLEGTLTKNITLFELLNILTVDDLDLKLRWGNAQVFKSMSAPLGVSKTGVIALDLHDTAHGPHGLVAGTTGSGKSEILQTYILAMVTLFHPYEVAFVIIDFKGGGMVNQFKTLPHLLGAITNIDGKEINRSLKSIKAELQKRQRLFAEADVNHIDKYITKFKAGEVKIPLPHLIIIVDEFAELKAEQPEFMKELISAARIGRSLGVHLILATQKPSGQVNEQIWSNSRFKLCLKVQSQADSNEVLKSPLAAEIKEPGRAYLQVGNNEIFELFQSAYSGASEKTDDSGVKEFTIYSLTESGKRQPVYVQKKAKSDEGSRTQLEAIVGYVADYCARAGLAKLHDICLPSLKSSIDFEMRASDHSTPGHYQAGIGIYDDPENQYQGDYVVDLGANNLMIIGSAQSGKTNILQGIIRGLTAKYSPNEVAIYIIDFASMTLKTFEKLRHVGGVVCPSEDEKLKNLFKLLHSEIERRKERLMAVGVSSFAAYQEAGEKDLPLIVLMIDNLSVLKELYFQENDDLLNLCREGLTVGISIVIANAQTAGIGYKYLSNFSSRIALFCNDINEYSMLFDHCSERIENIPGRCIIELDKEHFECQAYLAFKGEKEIDRVKEIRQYIADTNDIHPNAMAMRIPLIPSSLTKAYIVEQFAHVMTEPFRVVAGLDYATVTPYSIDLSSIGLLGITGRSGMGMHGWMQYMLDLLETRYPGATTLYAVDSIAKRLAPFKAMNRCAGYTMVAEEGIAHIKEIERQLKDRYDALVLGDEGVLDDAELLVLLIDNQDALAAISSSPEALAAYKNIIGRYKDMKVCMLCFIENANISYSAPDIVKDIRDRRSLMYFDDMSNMKLFDVPLAMAKRFKKAIEFGDGYYIRDNECVKLKTVLNVLKGDN